LRQFGNLLCAVAIVGFCQFGNGLGADVIAGQEHFWQYQQVGACGSSGDVQALADCRHIQRQGRALVEGDTHGVLLVLTVGVAGCGLCWQRIACGSWLACDAGGAVCQVNLGVTIASKPAPTGLNSFGVIWQGDWAYFIEHVAWAWVLRVGAATEVIHDAPYRVQRGLHRAFDPGRGPRYIITRNENTALFGGYILLHEMRVHPLVVAIMTRQGAFEGPQEMRIGLPRNGDRVADDTRLISTLG
jgi:hypothetical protein